ncbi:MAG: WG repeat-containing protein [Bacteroidales bacterium]|nr:WG repeat-containing protein [Bacteroidales bacterium]
MKTTIRIICLASMVWLAIANAFGQVSFVENDGKVSMINNSGKTVVEFQKNEDSWVIDDFKDGWGRIRVNGKVGLADENGWIVKPQKKAELFLHDGFYVLRYIDKVGVKTRDGKWLLEPTKRVYDWYGCDKVLPIKYDGKFGIMDKTGWIVEPTYDEMEWYSEDMLPVRKGRLWGFFDEEGRLVIKPQFKSVRRFNEGMAGVVVDRKWGFIDKTGEIVIAPAYDNIDCFFEGLAAVEVDGLWGFIDKNGEMVIEPRFRAVGIFSEGLAAFVIDASGWGYMDTSGNVVIKPQFDGANPFDETGKAVVRIGDDDTGVMGYVDRNGVFTTDETENNTIDAEVDE